MEVVKRICDSVSLLEDGKVIESGTLTDVVGAFGSRLSESLLRLPPTTALDPALGHPLEILDVAGGAELSALTAASRHFGVDFQVVAATVEQLGGSTFGRWRVLVRPPLSPAEVVAYLRQRGVHASEGSAQAEVTR
jgi:D-methionine transport system ATP-binding protein